jgi:hypothetical protein
MFNWNFDKVTPTATFDKTISQDIIDFNNFVKQNVFNNTAPPPAPPRTNTIPPINFTGGALSNVQKQEQPVIDYMTYKTPQPDELPDLNNVTNQEASITNLGYPSLLDAQDNLNPYG